MLARGLRARGHRQLIACRPGTPLAASARDEGFEVLPASWPRLRGALGGCDVVHAHSGHAFLASAGTKARRVASRYVAFEPRHPSVHRWKYALTCHAVIALSNPVREVLLRAGVPKRRIEVIVPGIEMPESLPDASERAAARARWGFAPEDFVAGHVAAFTAEKGQDVALEAALLVRQRFPRFRLILAGEGPLLAALGERYPGVAVMPGYVGNLRQLFAALDVCIMPSRSEAWGLAALRAMAHGLPVIASEVGGLPEVVEHGVSGWLVPPGDPAALAARIQTAAEAESIASFARAARERASHFSVARTVERTEAFYRRLLAESL